MSDWRPGAGRGALQQRAAVIRRMREFLDRRGLLEVQTPVAGAHGVTDVHIESVALAAGGFLRTSPEYWHKRLLAAGCGDLYELGPVFRKGERGRLHCPEFTLLEWYRSGWRWPALADEVIELIRHCLDPVADDWPLEWIPWRRAWRDVLGVDPLTADERDLVALAGDLHDPDSATALDHVFATRIQPQLPGRKLTIIHDYPASQAALAELHPDDARLAQRFEVFAGSLELANGYQELTDAGEQRRRFADDNRQREQKGRQTIAPDEAFLAALEAGLPDCAGVALGVDRLVMLATGAERIDAVRAFT